jgi:predicted nucleic acid-binding protein
MPKAMLDTQIFDRIAETPGLVHDINALAASGSLIILTTHIQEDELASLPDVKKAGEIKKIVRTQVPTAGSIYDLSRFGAATYGDGSPSGITIDQVRSPSKKHSADALIATSASQHADILVTEDARLRNKVTSLPARCQVWSFNQLCNWVFKNVTP